MCLTSRGTRFTDQGCQRELVADGDHLPNLAPAHVKTAMRVVPMDIQEIIRRGRSTPLGGRQASRGRITRRRRIMLTSQWAIPAWRQPQSREKTACVTKTVGRPWAGTIV